MFPRGSSQYVNYKRALSGRNMHHMARVPLVTDQRKIMHPSDSPQAYTCMVQQEQDRSVIAAYYINYEGFLFQ